METVRQHRSGRSIDISLKVSPVRDAEGRIVGASKIARDITARVRSYMQAGSLPNSSTATVTIQRSVALTGTDTASSILIEYPFQFMVLNPVVRLIAPGDRTTGAPITMKSTAIMRNEI